MTQTLLVLFTRDRSLRPAKNENPPGVESGGSTRGRFQKGIAVLNRNI
jgi:hypothetical protein